MERLRIVFMGTPDFAVPTLQALIDGPHEVVGVFCRPDKAKGRGQKLQMPPVKEAALAANIPVFQPTTLKDDAMKEPLAQLKPDVIVVIAYGMLLPKWVLDLPRLGCVNLHGSLLPKYRGAAPIQFAVLNGDTETGITLMQMDEGLDTGDMLMTAKIPVTEQDTAGTVFDRLAVVGGEMINAALDDLEAGKLTPVKQDEALASHTTKIRKDMGAIDWTQSAQSLACKIRAFNPSPGCFGQLNGKRVKLWHAIAVEGGKGAQPGTVVATGETGLDVATGDGVLRITEIQPESKKRMKAADYCRGYQIKAGAIFE